MDRVRKLNISESFTPSSESYSNYLKIVIRNHIFVAWLTIELGGLNRQVSVHVHAIVGIDFDLDSL
jgi:hypothetical protein